MKDNKPSDYTQMRIDSLREAAYAHSVNDRRWNGQHYCSGITCWCFKTTDDSKVDRADDTTDDSEYNKYARSFNRYHSL